MWNFIIEATQGEAGQEGGDGGQRSVMLTTHSMEECEALCTRVGILDQVKCPWPAHARGPVTSCSRVHHTRFQRFLLMMHCSVPGHTNHAGDRGCLRQHALAF